MIKNTILIVLTVAFMITVGVIIFSSGDFPLKMVWFVVSFFLTVFGAYSKMKRKENNKTGSPDLKEPGQLPQDDGFDSLLP